MISYRNLISDMTIYILFSKELRLESKLSRNNQSITLKTIQKFRIIMLAKQRIFALIMMSYQNM